MSVAFSDAFPEQRAAIEQQLESYLSAPAGCPARLAEAMAYSVLAPGKRLRPLLVLIACEAVGGEWKDALPAACAVEFVHVYSLIHDDLPAMDDDELRRGRPTCHRQFDEATAILAGDSLQMLAMEILVMDLPADVGLLCSQVLAKAAGRSALVGGQADDLAAEGRFGALPDGNTLEFLEQIHLRKTAALIACSLQLGVIAGRGDNDLVQKLGVFGRNIGLAFQIVDDCLDVESTAEQMGKMTRKDESLGKLTYPNLLGLNESKARANQLIQDAVESITVLGSKAEPLIRLAEFVGKRTS